MLEQTLAIVRNTFFESIRQPIVLVLLIAATLLLIIANVTSTFTMADDQKMLIDIGLATVFAFGALLAAFIASNVLTREIENRTVLTVVSKPVGRPLFVIGKYLGVALAILVASAYMAFVFMLVERHGVLQTTRDPYHYPVIVFGLVAALIAISVSVWCNYFYGKVFASTMVLTATPLAGLAYLLSLLFKHDFTFVANLPREFNANLWKGIIVLVTANMVLTAVAITVSTRANQVMTVVVTLFLFVGGMMSDHLFGSRLFLREQAVAMNRAVAEDEAVRLNVNLKIVRVDGIETGGQREIIVVNDQTYRELTANQRADLLSGARSPAELGLRTPDFAFVWSHLRTFGEKFRYLLGRFGYAVMPNFQVLWLSDAVTQDHVIPTTYVVRVLNYAALVIVAILSVAVILFQRREVG
ncbi:MAG: ABC transporter permease [Phycisphaeraceae bacterium]|nr:MAG: ABC transporter permease [Phycisphaeraceae bacterium]